ncbi:hypothetical protein [Arthrobacter glacialis]|nr:hypothetical protein [Arthrobacter glacialis]
MRFSIRATMGSVAVAALLGLGACAAPPTTTYTNEAGQEVTVNWKDYPVHAYSLPAELLDAPVKEDTEAVAAELFEEIKTALTAEYRMEWEARGEAGWFPTTGNGYGGQAMTYTYNSVEWRSTTLPPSTAEWKKIMSVINGFTTASGLGPVKLTPDSDSLANDPERQKELVEEYGTADLDKLYWWAGTAYSGSQWLSVNLVNVARDTSGKAAKEYQESELPARSISITYGTTTVSRADLPTFKKALEQFEGLTPPEPTTSD